jgi:hypothetical protein
MYKAAVSRVTMLGHYRKLIYTRRDQTYYRSLTSVFRNLGAANNLKNQRKDFAHTFSYVTDLQLLTLDAKLPTVARSTMTDL